MESKLQSLKVAELKQLLQAAGLPVSGNKPDLIQRLLQHPEVTGTLFPTESESVPSSTTTTTADVVVIPSSSSSTTTTATTPITPPPPTTTTTISEPIESQPILASVSLSQDNDQQKALIVELEKRKARATKFGLATDEIEKQLQRAIKFGVDANQSTTVSMIHQPLNTNNQRGDRGNDSGINRNAATKPQQTTEQDKVAKVDQSDFEKEKAKKRAERFGISTVPQPIDPEEEERKRKRAERFGLTQPQEKKVKA